MSILDSDNPQYLRHSRTHEGQGENGSRRFYFPNKCFHRIVQWFEHLVNKSRPGGNLQGEDLELSSMASIPFQNSEAMVSSRQIAAEYSKIIGDHPDIWECVDRIKFALSIPPFDAETWPQATSEGDLATSGVYNIDFARGGMARTTLNSGCN